MDATPTGSRPAVGSSSMSTGGLHGNNAGDGDLALLSAGQLEGGFFQHVLPQPNKLGGLRTRRSTSLVQPHVFGPKAISL